MKAKEWYAKRRDEEKQLMLKAVEQKQLDKAHRHEVEYLNYKEMAR